MPLPGLARYVTATGEEFDERKVNERRQFIGESKTPSYPVLQAGH